MLKYWSLIATIGLVSCAQEMKQWDLPDPNDSAMMANDIMDHRGYRADYIGIERRALEDSETKPLPLRKNQPSVRFSGEVGVSVGKQF